MTSPITATPGRRHSTSSTALAQAEHSPPEWITLTALGRLFGLSAVYSGRLLIQAGLREESGRPSALALRRGLAKSNAGSHRYATLWDRGGCRAALEELGMVPLERRNLVEQWAELLWALKQGSPSISTSAEQMAEDMPRELVSAVNRQLQQNGWDFQVPAHRPAAPSCRRSGAAQPSRSASACLRV
jgi:hypothetical protein